ncbi:MAG: PKD domain-containing protein [Eubacteriaceae bacterium]|jgi:hypothetical protein|nr:PKD domain-containing protein [Eubacteriaceae bacterium]
MANKRLISAAILAAMAICLVHIPKIEAQNIAAPQFYFRNPSVCTLEYAEIVVSNPFFTSQPWTAEYFHPFRGINVSITAPATSAQAVIRISTENTGVFNFRLISINNVDVAPIEAKLTVKHHITDIKIDSKPSEDDPYRISYEATAKRHCSNGSLAYNWKFSDGLSDTGAKADHQYMYGVSNFNAKVSITAKNGDLLTSYELEKKIDLPDLPKVQYKLDRESACSEEILSIVAFDLEKEDGMKWSFQYSVDAAEKKEAKCSKRSAEISVGKLAAGEHTVQIYDAQGKAVTELSISIIEPYAKTPKINASNTEDGTQISANVRLHTYNGVTCHAPFSYNWSFGDDSATETTQSDTALHHYSSPGDYQISLLAMSGADQIKTGGVLRFLNSGAGGAQVLTQASSEEALELPDGFGGSFSTRPTPGQEVRPQNPPNGQGANNENLGHEAAGAWSVANVGIVALSILTLVLSIFIRSRQKAAARYFDYALVEVISAILLVAMCVLTTDFAKAFAAVNGYTAIFVFGFALQLAACWLNFYGTRNA